MVKLQNKISFLIVFITICFIVYNLSSSSEQIDLIEKIKIDLKEIRRVPNETLKPRQRIFCLIITSNEALNTQARAINQTWARECDKHMFVTKLEKNSSQIELTKPLPIIQPQTYLPENSISSTKDMFWTYKYIWNRYSNFDWYLKTDDKTFFFIQNLRNYLQNQSHPSNAKNCANDWSSSFKKNPSQSHTSFVLSRGALEKFSKSLMYSRNYCSSMGHEYIDTNNCLKKLDIQYCNHKNLFYEHHFLQDYKKKGSKVFSESTISFPMVDHDETYRLYFWYNYYKLKNLVINVRSIVIEFANSTFD